MLKRGYLLDFFKSKQINDENPMNRLMYENEAIKTHDGEFLTLEHIPVPADPNASGSIYEYFYFCFKEHPNQYWRYTYEYDFNYGMIWKDIDSLDEVFPEVVPVITFNTGHGLQA